MSSKRIISISLNSLIFFVICLLSAHPSLASERYFTIQAGSYTPAGLWHARNNFDMLSQKLKAEERDHLRIGQDSKYYFVRVGKFEGLSAASKVLAAVKGLVPDAYILAESSTDNIKIVRTYDKMGSLPKAYYAVEAGKFDDPGKAEKLFELLGKTLKKDERATLRIGKIDKLFSVRVGRLEDKAEAGKLLEKIILIIDTAIVVNVQGKEEEIVKAYASKSAQLDAKEPTLERDADKGREAPPDPYPAAKPAAKKETPEDLMDRVSSQYYEQNYEKAVEILKKGIEKWPDNPDLHAWYGAVLLNMNSPDKAYDYYKKAAEISPDVPLYHTGTGVSLLGVYMEKAKASIEAFQKALQLDPNNVAALEGLGTVYVSIDRRNLAREIHGRLKELDAGAAQRLDEMILYGVDWGQ